MSMDDWLFLKARAGEEPPARGTGKWLQPRGLAGGRRPQPRPRGHGKKGEWYSVMCRRENFFLLPPNSAQASGVCSSIPQLRKCLTFQNEERQLSFWEAANFSDNEGSLSPPAARRHLARLRALGPCPLCSAQPWAPGCWHLARLGFPPHSHGPLAGLARGARVTGVEKSGHFLWSAYQMGITQPLRVFTSPVHGN